MDNAILLDLDVFDASASQVFDDSRDVCAENTIVLKPGFSVFHEPAQPKAVITTPEMTEYQRGVAAGEANANALNAATVATMQSALLNIQNRVSQLTAQIADDHFALLRDCLTALCPVLMEQETKQALLSILKTQYASSYAGVVTVQCHAENISVVEKLCGDVDVESSARFIVREADDLLPGQFSLTWSSGGASLDSVTVAQDILQRCRDILPPDPCPNFPLIPVTEPSDDV